MKAAALWRSGRTPAIAVNQTKSNPHAETELVTAMLAADPTAAQDHRFEADPVARAAGQQGHPRNPLEQINSRRRWIIAMPTSKEYRHRGEECLRLANETKEIFARMALLELVAEFRAMAQQLELRERRNIKQRFSAAAVRIRP